jgi:hypothetical protein
MVRVKSHDAIHWLGSGIKDKRLKISGVIVGNCDNTAFCDQAIPSAKNRILEFALVDAVALFRDGTFDAVMQTA